ARSPGRDGRLGYPPLALGGHLRRATVLRRLPRQPRGPTRDGRPRTLADGPPRVLQPPLLGPGPVGPQGARPPGPRGPAREVRSLDRLVAGLGGGVPGGVHRSAAPLRGRREGGSLPLGALA